jgi:tRNA(adenine34) deaminase
VKIRKRYRQQMELALELAAKASELGDVPVGAVILDRNGQLIAGAHNRRVLDADPTAHAEILAIRQAAERLGDWRLSGTTLVVTLEPCPMCAGALVNARVERLVFGCRDPKAGGVRSFYTLCEDPRLNHRVEVVGGVLEERCAAILSAFFAKLREPDPDQPTP